MGDTALHKHCTVGKLHTTIRAVLSEQTGVWYEGA